MKVEVLVILFNQDRSGVLLPEGPDGNLDGLRAEVGPGDTSSEKANLLVSHINEAGGALVGSVYCNNLRTDVYTGIASYGDRWEPVDQIHWAPVSSDIKILVPFCHEWINGPEMDIVIKKNR